MDNLLATIKLFDTPYNSATMAWQTRRFLEKNLVKVLKRKIWSYKLLNINYEYFSLLLHLIVTGMSYGHVDLFRLVSQKLRKNRMGWDGYSCRCESKILFCSIQKFRQNGYVRRVGPVLSPIIITKALTCELASYDMCNHLDFQL